MRRGAPTVIDGFRKSLAFDHVSFAYPGNAQPVLSDVTLKIHPGEVIAIVGRSGVGKSTLVDLIPRFNKATGGTIRIGRRRPERGGHLLPPGKLIGIVSQDIILFNDYGEGEHRLWQPDASGVKSCMPLSTRVC